MDACVPAVPESRLLNLVWDVVWFLWGALCGFDDKENTPYRNLEYEGLANRQQNSGSSSTP